MSENLGPSTQKGKPKFEMIRPETSARQFPAVRTMSDAESAALQGLTQRTIHQPTIQMPDLPQAQHSAHLRENFDMKGMVYAATHLSRERMVIGGVVTLALTLIIQRINGGESFFYIAGWVVVWGAICLYAHQQATKQAYAHSPGGMARHEQDSHVKIHDRMMATEDKRIDSQERIAMQELQNRREIGMAMLNRLESKRDE